MPVSRPFNLVSTNMFVTNRGWNISRILDVRELEFVILEIIYTMIRFLETNCDIKIHDTGISLK